ncbi:MAG: IS30 family transposase [Hydrogenophaga sp.]|uniref:IS30 family transposase n=1 Tax=Hydrogenophaga sp. TaxID=1904254 RepID=UPI002602DF9E|nr:IS30 family transposase [Hydrogenophaga sp.]MDD3786891.1 IS30 family transposase [Hydrogenophaga sp.]
MSPQPRTYRQLQPEDRVTLASLKQQNYSVREIARVLARSASTISRELRRNASAGQYSSAAAQQSCQHRRRQGRPVRKLHPEAILFDLVQHLLRQRWSPEQIALTLARICPKGHELRVSHETIYHCIYAQPVGELRKELIACLRHAHNKRVPRRKGQDRRGQIPDMLSIHLRPPEVQDRQFPGHWEGDLIKGEGNASAVGTLVERTSRLLILVKLPHPKPASAANVLQAFSDKLNAIAQPMRQSLTYDQGREMALHKKLTEQTGVAVYFCDPHSPWQRGSNENTNGLVRQYLPKGTDLSVYSQEQLDAIADQINGRPRKGLGVRSPLAVYRELLLNSPQHSTLIH